MAFECLEASCGALARAIVRAMTPLCAPRAEQGGFTLLPGPQDSASGLRFIFGWLTQRTDYLI